MQIILFSFIIGPNNNMSFFVSSIIDMTQIFYEMSFFIKWVDYITIQALHHARAYKSYEKPNQFCFFFFKLKFLNQLKKCLTLSFRALKIVITLACREWKKLWQG